MFSFDQYTTNIQPDYLIIDQYRNETVADTMVQQMVDMIRVQGDMKNFMTMNNVNTNIMSDWIGSVSYMSTMSFPP